MISPDSALNGICYELQVERRSGILGRLKGSIPFRVALTKSPSEMNEVGRAVKGSAFCLFSTYLIEEAVAVRVPNYP